MITLLLSNLLCPSITIIRMVHRYQVGSALAVLLLWLRWLLWLWLLLLLRTIALLAGAARTSGGYVDTLVHCLDGLGAGAQEFHDVGDVGLIHEPLSSNGFHHAHVPVSLGQWSGIRQELFGRLGAASRMLRSLRSLDKELRLEAEQLMDHGSRVNR